MVYKYNVDIECEIKIANYAKCEVNILETTTNPPSTSIDITFLKKITLF